MCRDSRLERYMIHNSLVYINRSYIVCVNILLLHVIIVWAHLRVPSVRPTDRPTVHLSSIERNNCVFSPSEVIVYTFFFTPD